MPNVATDSRIDPRIRAVFGSSPHLAPMKPGLTREQLIDETHSGPAREARAKLETFFESFDAEEVAPSYGLSVSEHVISSQPDGNQIRLRVIRPSLPGPFPCVYYIHGGGMKQFSCYNGNYRAWGRMIAAQGVVVAMVEFRNALVPSMVDEIAPFPGGLNDCVAGFRWLTQNATQLDIDPERVIIAGESGGANLAIASTLKLKRDGDLGTVAGLFALSPYLAGRWPRDEYPSSVENDGIVLNLRADPVAVAYGIEAYERQDPLAWPAFATADDLRGFPPTLISVSECDPLRDEGIAFYRRLLEVGVQARSWMTLGTTHAIEIFPTVCPDVSHDTAARIAAFARGR